MCCSRFFSVDLKQFLSSKHMGQACAGVPCLGPGHHLFEQQNLSLHTCLFLTHKMCVKKKVCMYFMQEPALYPVVKISFLSAAVSGSLLKCLFLTLQNKKIVPLWGLFQLHTWNIEHVFVIAIFFHESECVFLIKFVFN